MAPFNGAGGIPPSLRAHDDSVSRTDAIIRGKMEQTMTTTKKTMTSPAFDRMLQRVGVGAMVVVLCWMLPWGRVSAGADDRPLVRVRAASEIEGDRILLGDIAVIEAADPALEHQLAHMAVGKAPLPGMVRTIDQQYLITRLKQHRMDPGRLNLHLPERIQVSRRAMRIAGERIEAMVRRFLAGKMPWDPSDCRITAVQTASEVILPSGRLTCRIVPSGNVKYMGSVPLSVVFDVDGHQEKKVWATATIEVMAEVVVARKPLGRYKLITADDVAPRKMNLARLPGNVITTLDGVVGQRVKRTIAVNQVLRSDLIELPPLVNRGDIVTIVAETNNLQVSTLGEVQQKGCRGERIRVENLDSQKEVFALVVDAQTVKVRF